MSQQTVNISASVYGKHGFISCPEEGYHDRFLAVSPDKYCDNTREQTMTTSLETLSIFSSIYYSCPQRS
jgi:hypothetical protein